MRDHHSSDSDSFPSLAPFPLLQVRAGTAVVDGFGVRLFIKDAKLHIEDGIGPQRRNLTLNRHCGIRALLILAWSGSITLDAYEWLRNIGCSLIHINHAGELIASTIPHSIAGIRRRRKQVTATLTGLDVELTRFILTHKLEGQVRNLQHHLNAPRASMESVDLERLRLEQAHSVEALRSIEARASAAYWRAWTSIRIQFGPPRDLIRIPPAWLRFNGRSSIISGSPRAATSIPNALTNYIGALARSQCYLGVVGYGLDPMLGWLHQDQDNRLSATLDIQELVREHIEARVLELLASRHFTRGDFIELPNGACWVQPPFTHELAHEIPRWRSLALDAVASVAKFIDKWRAEPAALEVSARIQPSATNTKPWVPPSRRRSPSAPKVVKPYADRTSWVRRPPQQLRVPLPCARCSAPIHTRRRRHCDDCLRVIRVETGTFNVARAREILATKNVDPRFTESAQRQRAAAISAAHRANRGWAKTTVDWNHFRSTILPALHQLTLQTIADALGISLAWASRIRSGSRRPHPRHAKLLEALTACPRGRGSEEARGEDRGE